MKIKTTQPKTSVLTLSVLCSVLFACGAFAADTAGEPGRSSGKPNPLKNVYFGEQHMHTQNSFDAWTVGVRGSWAEAYEFAMGKPSKLSTTGEKMQRKTPYDFVAITDHSEYYGVFKNMADPKNPLDLAGFARLIERIVHITREAT